MLMENQLEKEGNIVQCGDFLIDIETVTKQSLISIRKVLPAEQYRLIKNRKSARICRRKRKMERNSMQSGLSELHVHNNSLQARLNTTLQQLKESQEQTRAAEATVSRQ